MDVGQLVVILNGMEEEGHGYVMHVEQGGSVINERDDAHARLA